MCAARISVVRVDHGLDPKYVLGKVPMFLPSEMFLVIGKVLKDFERLWGFRSTKANIFRPERFASIFAYDQEIFRRRFLGQPGVSCLN